MPSLLIKLLQAKDKGEDKGVSPPDLANMANAALPTEAFLQPTPKTLIEILIENLEGKYPARSHKHVHASDITKDYFCPRQTALLDLTKKEKKDQWQDVPQTTTYDLGNAVSDLIRGSWLKDKAVGHWVCWACGGRHEFQIKPQHCDVCHHQEFQYEEVRFHHSQYNFSGGVDVLVDVGLPKLWVVEIKIITPVDFETLKAPLAEHRLRTNLYLHLIENSQSPYRHSIDTQHGKVLYMTRAWGKKHEQYGKILPFKEFEIERNDEDLKAPLAKAEAVEAWRKDKLMPSGICQNSFCPIAKSCSVVKECWSGKYPALWKGSVSP